MNKAKEIIVKSYSSFIKLVKQQWDIQLSVFTTTENKITFTEGKILISLLRGNFFFNYGGQHGQAHQPHLSPCILYWDTP